MLEGKGATGTAGFISHKHPINMNQEPILHDLAKILQHCHDELQDNIIVHGTNTTAAILEDHSIKILTRLHTPILIHGEPVRLPFTILTTNHPQSHTVNVFGVMDPNHTNRSAIDPNTALLSYDGQIYAHASWEITKANLTCRFPQLDFVESHPVETHLLSIHSGSLIAWEPTTLIHPYSNETTT